MATCHRWLVVSSVFFLACINPGVTSKADVNITPGEWYSGDIHVHRNCGEGTAFVTEEKLAEMMEESDLDVVVLMADMGNGEVQDPKTDLLKVTGKDAVQSSPGRILHWEAEWHWDATYSKFEHQALGGHLLLLGLNNAQQVWEESPYKILEWAKKQNAVTGFTHLQYLQDTIQSKLDCCLPLDLPVEAAHGTIDFVSQDVYSTHTEKGHYSSEAVLYAYYKLLDCGFRLALTAGTDFPCNNEEPLGSLLTFVNVKGELNYDKWVVGIKKGNTVVSRNGNHEFVDLTVNEKYKPGDTIAIDGQQTISVSADWLSDAERKGTVEFVVNGKVIKNKAGSSKPGKPLTITMKIPIAESSWIAARTVRDGEHITHTSPVYITNGKAVRGNKADAQYFIDWIDNMLTKIAPGGEWHHYFPNDYENVRARYLAAKEVYIKIRNESK